MQSGQLAGVGADEGRRANQEKDGQEHNQQAAGLFP
jgi:hypothetical protein